MTAGRKSVTDNKDWGTPQKYVDAVKECLGGVIYLDPCSNQHSIVNAKVEYFPPKHNGLLESWNYKTIYVNPPYGADKERNTKIKDWLRKCEEANRLYHSEVIALIPVATNTGHWKRYVFGRATAICFLYDTRLKFLVNGRGGGKGAPMSCAMVYWGRNYKRFFDVFIKYGAVIKVENLRGIDIGIENNGNGNQKQEELPFFKKNILQRLMPMKKARK